MNAYAVKNSEGKYWTGKNWGPITLAKEWATKGGAMRAAQKLASEDSALSVLCIIQTV
jgi:hypothetical protein